MTSGWLVLGLPAASAGVASLEADAVMVGQFLVARPMVVGPLVGAAAGDLAAGLGLGALVELFCLEDLPVGSIVPLNGAVAAGTAVLLVAGPAGLPPAAALPAGLLFGAAHGWLECRVRSWRAALTARAARELSTEGRVDWRGLWRSSLGAHWLSTAAFIYAALALGGPALSWAWRAAPLFARAGFERAWPLATWLSLGVLVTRLWR